MFIYQWIENVRMLYLYVSSVYAVLNIYCHAMFPDVSFITFYFIWWALIVIFGAVKIDVFM